ncbi:MAG: DUF6766 family protein [Acidimicrobiales bacterium]
MVLAVTAVVSSLVLAFLVFAMVRSMRNERTEGRSIWREFGLSIVLLTLFLVSWAGQGITQWQVFTDEQKAHGEEPAMGDFLAEFGQSTLENWQSEFLQLFSFIALAALYIHKGSSESKDGEERMEASLKRIEQHLGTLPSSAPSKHTDWKLPETPLQVEDQELASGPASNGS